MKVIDISMAISHDMMVYKNRDEKRPQLKALKTYENADFYESRIDMDLHTGTHVDTPLHMINGGMTMDQLPLDLWHGEAVVVDVSACGASIGSEALKDFDILRGDIVILKTQNSFKDDFDPDFAYLTEDGAHFLSAVGVKGVGIDALGIERAQPGHETHVTLFNKGIFILEGLRLAHVKEGRYYLMALPLAIEGAEASPVRAVLLESVK